MADKIELGQRYTVVHPNGQEDTAVAVREPYVDDQHVGVAGWAVRVDGAGVYGMPDLKVQPAAES